MGKFFGPIRLAHWKAPLFGGRGCAISFCGKKYIFAIEAYVERRHVRELA